MALGLPKIDFDIGETVREFLTELRSINTKLDTLVDLQRQNLTADRLAAATARRMTRDQSAEIIGSVVNSGAGLRLHEVNDRGEVTFCPVASVNGEPRNHQVRVDGEVLGCFDPATAPEVNMARTTYLANLRQRRQACKHCTDGIIDDGPEGLRHCKNCHTPPDAENGPDVAIEADDTRVRCGFCHRVASVCAGNPCTGMRWERQGGVTGMDYTEGGTR